MSTTNQILSNCWELDFADRICAHTFVITDWFRATVMCLICYIVPNNFFKITVFDAKFKFTVAFFNIRASYFFNLNLCRNYRYRTSHIRN
jgi:hypothetical protein